MVLMHGDVTHLIIGAAFKVHTKLGSGFQEVIFQRALAHEFDAINLKYFREQEMNIHYPGLNQPIGKRRADFLVEECIIVEVKATKSLEPFHLAQLMNYLKVYNVEVGLLINFGEKSLKFERRILTKSA